MIRNHMEYLIDDMLKELLKKHPEMFKCTCTQCIDDIMAISLNNVKPFYTTCKIGEVFGEYNNKAIKSKVAVATELSIAIETVGENPRHE